MSGRASLGFAVITSVGLLVALGSSGHHQIPRLLWNTTASAPLGLYRVTPIRALHIGDWVAIRPPKALAEMLNGRGVLPLGVPLLKQIVALSPSMVCRFGPTISADGHVMALAQARDRQGKVLPTWSGCRRLRPGDVFLLNSALGSFDSRYFGPLHTDRILGQARPIWLVGARP